MTTITIEKAIVHRALSALEYHTQQTRPIHNTELVIEELRTALSAPATAPDLSAAYIGAREDLAVWKKRALEAEETARQLNRALAEEVNGPTFMGEPVLPATAPEKTVKEIMEFARHYAANTFSSATLEDKIRRSLAASATAPERKPMTDADIEAAARRSGAIVYINRFVNGFAFLFGPKTLRVFVRAVEAFHDIKGTP